MNKSFIPVKPRIFIPTLYFAEGLPFTIVKTMSIVFFKTLALDNELIGLYTSLLYLPWTCKLFWAPVVDLVGTRRLWIIACQILLALLTALLAMAVFAPQSIWLLLLIFSMLAIVSATQDIAIDGYYLEILEKDQQAFYVGIRNAAYKIAWLFGAGGLVAMAGSIAERLHQANSTLIGWSFTFVLCAVIFSILSVFHALLLPRSLSSDTKPGSKASTLNEAFPRIMRDFFDQPGIKIILTYVLIFRLGDAFLMTMAQPFLLDPQSAGGLGFSVSNVGEVYGLVGTFFLLIGGVAGGALISKGGLERFIMPFALVQNLSILLYWFLAINKPNLILVCCVNAFEQLSYGLGTAAYTVLLLSTVKPKYKATQYAAVTAFMALGVMLPGMVSGYLVTKLGYANFFLFSFFASLPGIMIIPFIPLKQLAAQRVSE
jgi:PAT family beta-lactamase induction signal transducer AmpG